MVFWWHIVTYTEAQQLLLSMPLEDWDEKKRAVTSCNCMAAACCARFGDRRGFGWQRDMLGVWAMGGAVVWGWPGPCVLKRECKKVHVIGEYMVQTETGEKKSVCVCNKNVVL